MLAKLHKNESLNPPNFFRHMITSQKVSITPRILPALLGTFVLAVLGLGNVTHGASVRFLPMSEEIAARKIGLQDGKALTMLADLNVRKRSKAYTCKIGAKPLTLVALDRQRPNGLPAGVEISVAPEMKSPLVLIVASADAPSGMRTIVIEDGTNDFPWGSLRFVNTTEKPYIIRYDKETKAIPGEPKAVDVIPGGEARNMGVQLFSEAEPDAILYSAVWEHDPNLRKLIFILSQADAAHKELKLEVIPQDRRAKD